MNANQYGFNWRDFVPPNQHNDRHIWQEAGNKAQGITNFKAGNFNPRAEHWKPVVEVKVLISEKTGFMFYELHEGKQLNPGKPVPLAILQKLKISRHTVYIKLVEERLIIDELVSSGMCQQPVDELVYEMALP